jgi:hypothetical protein
MDNLLRSAVRDLLLTQETTYVRDLVGPITGPMEDGNEGRLSDAMPDSFLSARRGEYGKRARDRRRIEVITSSAREELAERSKASRLRASRCLLVIIACSVMFLASVIAGTVLIGSGMIPATSISFSSSALSGLIATVFLRIYQQEARHDEKITDDLRQIRRIELEYLIRSESSVAELREADLNSVTGDSRRNERASQNGPRERPD